MSRENVHLFGDQEILLGILTEPENPVVPDLCVVFLNAGLLHHVGPYRMHVDFARELARLGLNAFRFDLSGLGDSLMRDIDQSDVERAVADIRDAFDHLQKTKGFTRFVTVGLCSGADNAHALALMEPRLAGAVMMDGPGYPNLKFKIHHFAPKLTRLQSWKTMTRIAAQRLRKPVEDETARESGEYPGDYPGKYVEAFVRDFAPQAQVGAEIQKIADRGTELLYLYTGGVQYYFNHASQFQENFPNLRVNAPGARIQCEFYPQSDHTYSDPRDRALMQTRVSAWIREKFMNGEPHGKTTSGH